MATFISFTPAPGNGPARFEILEFDLDQAGTNGADGLGYPAHLRRQWLQEVHKGVVIMLGMRLRPGMPPVSESLYSAHKAGKVFAKVTVEEPRRRVEMRLVKVSRYASDLHKPDHAYVSFEHVAEQRW